MKKKRKLTIYLISMLAILLLTITPIIFYSLKELVDSDLELGANIQFEEINNVQIDAFVKYNKPGVHHVTTTRNKIDIILTNSTTENEKINQAKILPSFPIYLTPFKIIKKSGNFTIDPLNKYYLTVLIEITFDTKTFYKEINYVLMNGEVTILS